MSKKHEKSIFMLIYMLYIIYKMEADTFSGEYICFHIFKITTLCGGQLCKKVGPISQRP
jgi:hypothetical protein